MAGPMKIISIIHMFYRVRVSLLSYWGPLLVHNMCLACVLLSCISTCMF